MEFIVHIVEHALEDTVALIPFLFITYLALEALERAAGGRANDAVRRAGGAGPVVGALLGVVPQCGFSAMAATLYAGRVVTLGTLVAVFLSTSDEMLPMLVAERVDTGLSLTILGSKVAIALVTGIVVDLAIRALRHNARVHALLRKTVLGVRRDGVETDVVEQMAEGGEDAEHICRLCEQDHCGCGHDHHRGHAHDHGCGHGAHGHGSEGHDHHDGSGAGKVRAILLSALSHTVQVTVFILLVSMALVAVLETVGRGRSRRFSRATRCSRSSPRRWWDSCPTAPRASSSRSSIWRGCCRSRRSWRVCSPLPVWGTWFCSGPTAIRARTL